MSNKFDELFSALEAKAEPTLAQYKPYSIAWIVQRVIDETRANPSMKQHGESHLYALRRMQRVPIGKKDARKLTRQDIIEFAKALRSGALNENGKGVQACTVNQMLSYLGGVLDTASATWEDCVDVKREPIRAAMPFLKKNGLVGKGEARKVRPAEEQLERIKAWFSEAAKNSKMKLKHMDDLVEFSVRSSRRRGELCRMTHGDVDYEKRIYWVRDIKHPTKKKKGNDKFFILTQTLEAIIRRQPRLRPEDPRERIWPYNPASVTQAYIRAKKALGITGIRLHDNRGEAITRALLSGQPPEDVRLLLSGHNNTTGAMRWLWRWRSTRSCCSDDASRLRQGERHQVITGSGVESRHAADCVRERPRSKRGLIPLAGVATGLPSLFPISQILEPGREPDAFLFGFLPVRHLLCCGAAEMHLFGRLVLNRQGWPTASSFGPVHGRIMDYTNNA